MQPVIAQPKRFVPLVAILGFLSFAPVEADTEAEEPSLKREKASRGLRVPTGPLGVDANGNSVGPNPDHSLSSPRLTPRVILNQAG